MPSSPGQALAWPGRSPGLEPGPGGGLKILNILNILNIFNILNTWACLRCQNSRLSALTKALILAWGPLKILNILNILNREYDLPNYSETGLMLRKLQKLCCHPLCFHDLRDVVLTEIPLVSIFILLTDIRVPHRGRQVWTKNSGTKAMRPKYIHRHQNSQFWVIHYFQDLRTSQ